MNKLDLELAKLNIGAIRYGNTLSLIKHGMTMATVFGCILMMSNSLRAMATASPASVNALAALAKELKFADIIGYIVATGTTTAWLLERRGKKRIVKKASDTRKMQEAGDPYRGSSELTDTGDTPA